MIVEKAFVAIADGISSTYVLRTETGATLLAEQLVDITGVQLNGVSRSLGSVRQENNAITFLPTQRVVNADTQTLFAETINPPIGTRITWSGEYLELSEIYEDAASYLDLVIHEHAKATNFNSLLASLVNNVTQLQGIYRTIESVYDLDTAVRTQLDAVGEWIGLGREVLVPIENVFFEWDDAEQPTRTGWDYGVWQGRFEASASVQRLPDDVYRRALRAKVLINQWDGSRPGLYNILNTCFAGRGVSFRIVDNQDMTFDIHVDGTLAAVDQAILTTGYLPIRPGGIGLNQISFS